MSLLLFFQSGSAGTTYTYTGSGGLTFAGSADRATTRAAQIGGGVAFSGAGDRARTKAPQVGGGLTFGGAATTVPPPRTFTYTPSGGVIFAGASWIARTKVFAASGGIQFGGSADTTPPAAVYTYTATGGIAFAGVAVTQFVAAQAVIRGRVLVTGARKPRSFTYYGRGGWLHFGGSADVEFERRPRIVEYVGAARFRPSWGGPALVAIQRPNRYVAIGQGAQLRRPRGAALSSYIRAPFVVARKEGFIVARHRGFVVKRDEQ